MKSTQDSQHKGNIIDTAQGCSVIACNTCGFTHILPLPTKEALKVFYEKKFYDSEKINYFKDAEKDATWWLNVYRSHYAILSKHTTGRHLLDIGSGPGYFLKCGIDLGWDVLGVEPSNKAFQYSTKKLKVPVIKGIFEPKIVKGKPPFNVVYMSLVLEHIVDPHMFIQNVRSVLAPGGLIAIQVPNDYNPLQLMAQQTLHIPKWWVVPTHHINYFSFDTLRKLLKKNGFSIVDSLATFPMEFFLLSGSNYVKNPTLGRKCHIQRKVFEQNLYRNNPEMLNRLYRNFARMGIGRECIIIAKLKSSP